MKNASVILPLLGFFVLSSCQAKDDGKAPLSNVPYEFPGTKVSQVQFASGLFIANGPNEISLSVGSGLRVESYNPDTGEAILVGMSDRGPNVDSPNLLNAPSGLTATKVFAISDFQPSLFRMSFHPEKGFRILERVGLNVEGKPVTGLPIPPGSMGSSGELGLTADLRSLPFDANGLDPEGIDFESDGLGWICDEYGPFLAKVDMKTGAIVKKVGPGQGLPEILAQRQPNRGFEGLAISGGRIYAVVQSTLDVAGKTKKIADFIRLVEFDPQTNKTRMFAYPIDAQAYKKTSDAKLGDLVALGEGRFAVIEQGKRSDDSMHNVLYGIDLADATDLSGQTIAQGKDAGKELEFTTLAQLATQGIKPLRKVELADLRALGWTEEKAEGLTLLNSKTMMIASDNDFGLSPWIENGPGVELDDYKVDDEGKLHYKGNVTQARYQIKAQTLPTQMMLLKRDTDFSSFSTQ